jgi:hypothetical protein
MEYYVLISFSYFCFLKALPFSPPSVLEHNKRVMQIALPSPFWYVENVGSASILLKWLNHETFFLALLRNLKKVTERSLTWVLRSDNLANPIKKF